MVSHILLQIIALWDKFVMKGCPPRPVFRLVTKKGQVNPIYCNIFQDQVPPISLQYATKSLCSRTIVPRSSYSSHLQYTGISFCLVEDMSLQ